jgi:hypothetical protein
MIVFEESDDANIIRKDKVLEESGNDVNIIWNSISIWSKLLSKIVLLFEESYMMCNQIVLVFEESYMMHVSMIYNFISIRRKWYHWNIHNIWRKWHDINMILSFQKDKQWKTL